MFSPLWNALTNVLHNSDERIAFLLAQRKEQALLRRHQWRTPLVSDTRFDSWTSQAAYLVEALSDATEPIPVNCAQVHLLAEAEDDVFHDPELLSPPADEGICLLSDTLEAMLVDDLAPNHQGHAAAHLATPPLVTSEIEPMTDRELLMCDTNPVCLTSDDPE